MSHTITVRLDKELADWLAQTAAETGVPQGQFIREQLERAMLALESTTMSVKLNAPWAVGVPEITPVEGFSVRPGGKAPVAMENVYGPMPPTGTI